MGDVYRARDTVLGRDAAVKVLHVDKLQDGEARQRFLREARAASTLNHPNVVTVYEIGSELASTSSRWSSCRATRCSRCCASGA